MGWSDDGSGWWEPALDSAALGTCGKRSLLLFALRKNRRNKQEEGTA